MSGEGLEFLGMAVRMNFDKWVEAVQSGDPGKVTKLFSRKAVFLPTLAGDIRRGRKETENYFEHFLKKNPTCRIIEDEVLFLGEASYCHAGLYEFEIDNGLRRAFIEARFSFIWQYDGAGWKILHFHSSQRPQ